MDDNKFNKIMEDYVSSTSNRMETDLKKLPEKPQKNKILFNRIALTSGIAVIVLLLIILPIHFLNTEQEQPTDEIRYYDNNSITLQTVENNSKLEDFGIKEYLVPRIIVDPSVSIYCLADEPSVYLGAKIQYIVFDYDFEIITIDIIQKQYKLQKFDFFEDFTDNTDWNGTSIKHSVSYNDIKETYNTQIYFSIDQYDYFIEVETYDQLEPSIILDYIY